MNDIVNRGAVAMLLHEAKKKNRSPIFSLVARMCESHELLRRELSYARRVAAAAVKLDEHGDLFWLPSEFGVRAHAKCSDFFAWGCCDSEEISPENLPVYEALAAEWKELSALTNETNPSEVFAGRVRGRRPQSACYRGKSEATKALFDSFGPPENKEPL